LIQDKIKSINNLCFGIKERGNHDTDHFRKRVFELSKMREEIKELLASAEETGAEIEIDASIQIHIKEAVKG
jgi:GTP-sensing pleiotropic transcriptional regulator CodY